MAEIMFIKKIQDRLEVYGDLNFQTVVKIWQQSQSLLEGQIIKIDLKHVKCVNSAGLVLLLEWIRYARKMQRTIQFFHIPPQLIFIAKAANINNIIMPYIA